MDRENSLSLDTLLNVPVSSNYCFSLYDKSPVTFSTLQPYYELIDTMKESAFRKFVAGGDPASKVFRQQIHKEIKAIDKLRKYLYAIDKSVYFQSLLPVYKAYSNLRVRERGRTPFYYFSELKKASMFNSSYLCLTADNFEISGRSIVIGENVEDFGYLIPAIEKIELERSCKISSIHFCNPSLDIRNDLSAFSDIGPNDDLTWITLEFEGL